MALVESCSQWLSTEPGVAELLVQYLHEKPRTGATDIEKSACERLQQKSATAIRRLSDSRDVGLIFVELHCTLYCCLSTALMLQNAVHVFLISYGCDKQHITYSKQRLMKKEMIRLASFGLWSYKNRARSVFWLAVIKIIPNRAVDCFVSYGSFHV